MLLASRQARIGREAYTVPTMKGGTGTIGRGSIGVARASGGPKSGAVRSMGSLSSPEGPRFGVNTAANFSSAGFAKSKPGLISTDSFSRKSASLVNLNFGRESKPSFARTNSLKSRIGMINRFSIPDRPSPITPIGLNINRGKERNSKIARTPTLARRGMFDVSRPKTLNTIVPHEVARPVANPNIINTVKSHETLLARPRTIRSKEVRRPVQRVEAFAKPLSFRPRQVETYTPNRNRPERQRPFATPLLRIRQENVTARPEVSRVVMQRTESKKVSPFENTLVLWRNPNIAPRVKLEAATTKAVEQRRATLRRKVEEYFKRPQQKLEHQIRVKTERSVHARKSLKRVELKHMIRIMPTVTAQERLALHRDIKDAKKMIPKVMLARRVGHRVAVSEMAKVLTEKHKGKITITPLEKQILPMAESQLLSAKRIAQNPKTNASVSSDLEHSRKPDEDADEVEADKTEGKKKLQEGGGAASSGRVIFYYEKDIRANYSRVNRAVDAFKTLMKYKKPKNGFLTGEDISYSIKDATQQEKSEVRGSAVDGSHKAWTVALSKLGRYSDASRFEREASHAAAKNSAIRLTFTQKNGIKADRKSTEIVFESALEGQDAYFEENVIPNGVFKEDKNGVMWFLPTI